MYLCQCCIENSLKVASVLALNGANVNVQAWISSSCGTITSYVGVQDNDWWTPLHAASACGHWRIVNFLISNDADPTIVNSDGELPIDIAEGEKTAQILADEMQRRGACMPHGLRAIITVHVQGTRPSSTRS